MVGRLNHQPASSASRARSMTSSKPLHLVYPRIGTNLSSQPKLSPFSGRGRLLRSSASIVRRYWPTSPSNRPTCHLTLNLDSAIPYHSPIWESRGANHIMDERKKIEERLRKKESEIQVLDEPRARRKDIWSSAVKGRIETVRDTGPSGPHMAQYQTLMRLNTKHQRYGQGKLVVGSSARKFIP